MPTIAAATSDATPSTSRQWRDFSVTGILLGKHGSTSCFASTRFGLAEVCVAQAPLHAAYRVALGPVDNLALFEHEGTRGKIELRRVLLDEQHRSARPLSRLVEQLEHALGHGGREPERRF